MSEEKIHELEQELKIRIEDNEDLYANLCETNKQLDEANKRIQILDKQNKKNYEAFNTISGYLHTADAQLSVYKERLEEANDLLVTAYHNSNFFNKSHKEEIASYFLKYHIDF